MDRQEVTIGDAAARSSSWECQHVRCALAPDTVERMEKRARAWSVAEGGRFMVLPDRILLWSGRQPRRLVGAIGLRRDGPSGQALVTTLSWNPVAGGTLDEACTALELLVGTGS